MTPDHPIRCADTVLSAGGPAPSGPRTDECLYHHLCRTIDEHGCDHGHAHVEEWCDARGAPRHVVLAWARSTGGYCDCETLVNSMGRVSMPFGALRCTAGSEEIYRRDEEEEWVMFGPDDDE